uniref:Polycystin cation channel PKD1/PKD2 domain-containing protein n=1 Tax=Tetraselmis sp. GSL018 TaxID=582737 RepID=A0A061QZ39_9CHLO
MGEPFRDPGAVAIDDVDGNVTSLMYVEGAALVDTSIPTMPGSPWQVSYHARDRTGNKAAVRQRLIEVICPDGEAICVSAVHIGSAQEGVRLSCAIREICDKSGGVLFGKYMVSGDVPVEDLVLSEEGLGSRQRVIMEERHPPSISLIGPSTVMVPLGSSYPSCTRIADLNSFCDQGARAHDSEQGDITDLVFACPSGAANLSFAASGLLPCSINTRTPGKRNVTFQVTNDANLTASVNRTVVVLPVCPPGERACLEDLTCSEGGVCVGELLNGVPINVENLFKEERQMGNESPQIQLQGDTVIRLPQGNTWELCSKANSSKEGALCDEGARAYDAEDGDLSADVLACPPASCHVERLDCFSHRVAVKGVAACLPERVAELSVGTILEVEFVVFDHGNPAMSSSINRTLVIVQPCPPGQFICDRECSQVSCDLRDFVLAATGGSQVLWVVELSLVGPSEIQVSYHSGFLGSPSSLEPCPGIGLLGSDPSEPPTDCGAVAKGIGADGTAMDLSRHIQLSLRSACSSCPFCVPEAALRGLCDPGAYEYEYSIAGTSASATRMVTIVAAMELNATVEFSTEGDLLPEQQLEALRFPQTEQETSLSLEFRDAFVKSIQASADSINATDIYSMAFANLSVQDARIADITLSGASVLVTFELQIHVGESGIGRADTVLNTANWFSIDRLQKSPYQSAAETLMSLLDLASDPSQAVNLNLAASLAFSGSSPETATFSVASFRISAPEPAQADAFLKRAFQLEGMLMHIDQSVSESIEGLQSAAASWALTVVQEEAAGEAAAKELIEIHKDLLQDAEESLKWQWNHLLLVAESIGTFSSGFLSGVEAQADLQLSKSVKVLKEILADLEIGRGGLSPGSIGFEMWSVIEAILFTGCQEKMSNYSMAFEVSHQGESAGAYAMRRLLATGGSSGTSTSKSRDGSKGQTVSDASWNGYNIVLANRSWYFLKDADSRSYHVGHSGSSNQILAGLLVHQRRKRLLGSLEECSEPQRRFTDLDMTCNVLAFLEYNLNKGPHRDAIVKAQLLDPLSPFGTDPVFMHSSDLYNPFAAARESFFYNTTPGSEDINHLQAPFGFFPRNLSGFQPGFPLLVDTRLDSFHVAQVWKGLADGAWIDRKTHEMKARLMTSFPGGLLSLADVDFTWMPDGSIQAKAQVAIAENHGVLAQSPRMAWLAVQAALTLWICFVGLREFAKEKRMNVLLLPLVGVSIAVLVFQAMISREGAELRIRGFYDLYDAISFAVARWWMPLKDASSLTAPEANVSLGSRAAGAMTMPTNRGDPGRWRLPDNPTGINLLGHGMKGITRLVSLSSWITFCQGLFLALLVTKWLGAVSCDARIGTITATLRNSLGDLAHFFIVTGILIVMTSAMAHVLFGNLLADASSFADAVELVFAGMVSGDFSAISTLVKGQDIDLVWGEVFGLRLFLAAVPTLFVLLLLPMLLAILANNWEGEFVRRKKATDASARHPYLHYVIELLGSLVQSFAKLFRRKKARKHTPPKAARSAFSRHSRFVLSKGVSAMELVKEKIGVEKYLAVANVHRAIRKVCADKKNADVQSTGVRRDLPANWRDGIRKAACSLLGRIAARSTVFALDEGLNVNGSKCKLRTVSLCNARHSEDDLCNITKRVLLSKSGESHSYAHQKMDAQQIDSISRQVAGAAIRLYGSEGPPSSSRHHGSIASRPKPTEGTIHSYELAKQVVQQAEALASQMLLGNQAALRSLEEMIEQTSRAADQQMGTAFRDEGKDEACSTADSHAAPASKSDREDGHVVQAAEGKMPQAHWWGASTADATVEAALGREPAAALGSPAAEEALMGDIEAQTRREHAPVPTWGALEAAGGQGRTSLDLGLGLREHLRRPPLPRLSELRRPQSAAPIGKRRHRAYSDDSSGKGALLPVTRTRANSGRAGWLPMRQADAIHPRGMEGHTSIDIPGNSSPRSVFHAVGATAGEQIGAHNAGLRSLSIDVTGHGAADTTPLPSHEGGSVELPGTFAGDPEEGQAGMSPGGRSPA